MGPKQPILEVCVDTIQGARAAVKGGADRIELCASLSEGGLTPSAGLMRAAASLPIPCFAMIRPRCGLFNFDVADTDIMLSDISMAREIGLAGVVLGAQNEKGELNTELLEKLVFAAGAMEKTLHRVIDIVPDPFAALELAMQLGFERVLTSGTARSAHEGADIIAQMVEKSNGVISIMPGGGLTPENVSQVVKKTAVTEVHASCKVSLPNESAAIDFNPPTGRFETSESQVQRMIAALT